MKKIVINRRFWGSVSTMLLLATWLWGYLFWDPHGRIMYSSSEWVCRRYLLFYEQVMKTTEFDGLLEQLMNNDYRYASYFEVCRFVEERSKCSLIPYMEVKCSYFDALPQDSVIPYTHYRFFNKRKVLYYAHHQDPDNLCRVVERLRARCGVNPGELSLPLREHEIEFRRRWREKQAADSARGLVPEY